MKKLFIGIFLISGIKLSYAQNAVIPVSITSVFEGTWQYKTRFQTNTVKIRFEQGKDYALFMDIGSGEAPAKILRAAVKGKLLVITAIQNQNDDIELEVIDRKLILRVKRVLWNKEGNRLHSDSVLTDQRIFRRIVQPHKP
ncbi:hypothetical protein AAW12_24370 [Sphingobacterium sp. Ag1]|nr:hypothetical protein AAW12_24370 [Sphingobacterium sp. Ag1]